MGNVPAPMRAFASGDIAGSRTFRAGRREVSAELVGPAGAVTVTFGNEGEVIVTLEPAEGPARTFTGTISSKLIDLPAADKLAARMVALSAKPGHTIDRRFQDRMFGWAKLAVRALNGEA